MISSRPEGWFFSSYVASHLRNWICRWWTGGSFGGWGSISVGGVLQSVPLRSHSIFFTDDDLGRLGVTYIFWSCYIACEFYSTLPCRLSPLAHLSGQRRSCTDIAAAVIEKKKFSLFCELRPEEGRLVYVKISILSSIYYCIPPGPFYSFEDTRCPSYSPSFLSVVSSFHHVSTQMIHSYCRSRESPHSTFL